MLFDKMPCPMGIYYYIVLIGVNNFAAVLLGMHSRQLRAGDGSTCAFLLTLLLRPYGGTTFDWYFVNAKKHRMSS